MSKTEDEKRKVFNKGKPIKGKNPDTYRKDDNGKTIKFGSYGTQGEYGWEIDHKNPKAKGGTDSIENLRPLNTADNRKKSDKYPDPTKKLKSN